MVATLLLILSTLSAPAATPSQPISSKTLQEKIEARVGKEIITSTDIAMMLEGLRSERPTDSAEDLRKAALSALIDQALITQYLNDQGLGISERDIEQRIAGIRSMNGIQTEEQFRTLLGQQGLTFDRFKAQLRRQFEQGQFMQLMRRNIEGKLPKVGDKIGQQELLAFYKNNESLFKSNLEIELQECIIPFGAKPAETEALAREFQAAPAKFEACVKQHSQSPSKAQNGILGKFTRGMLRDDIESRVFGLKQGDVAMIRMPGGIQLLKLKKVKDLGPNKFDDIQDRVRERLAQQLIEKEIQNTLAELKSKIYIKI